MTTDKKRSLLQRLAIATVLGLAATTGIAACASSEEPPAEQAEAPRARGPAAVVIEETLEWGDLTPDQEAAVLAIGEDITLDRDSRAQIRSELRASAAGVIRAGHVESPEFKEAIERALAVMEQRMLASSDAIKDVHELLDPAQRALVADALRTRIEEHRENAKLREHDVRFGNVAKKLMLNAFQIDKLKALRKEAASERKHGRPSYEELLALVDAFEGESFAASLDEFNEAKREKMRQHVKRAGEHADTALSLLEGHQRILLADLVEKHEGPREH